MLSSVTNSTTIAPLAQGGPITMSSREIAELVGSRHDKVKQSIERLADRGVISRPPMGSVVEVQHQPNGGTKEVTIKVYRLEKRDSFVVVAQLSPEFTARLVDRWQQLEEEKASGGFALPQSYEQALEGLLAKVRENNALMIENRAKDAEIGAMRDDVAAHERLTKAQGSLNITEAAKNLGMRPKDLFDWMSHNGWIYKRPGSASWLGYAPRCDAGDLWHKSTTVLRADGSEKITEQVRITPKGLSKLAKLIFPAARLIGGGK